VIGAEAIAPLVPRGPAVLHDAMRDVVCSFTDAHVIEWAMSSDLAREVLSDREQAFAAKLLGTDSDDAEAARYIRQQLRTGDHVQARARMALAPGAVLTLGGRRYTVTGRRGERMIELTGERAGKADLSAPPPACVTWVIYRGGVTARNRKIEQYRRDDSDGTFTAAP
jgi:hypothetical protein